MKEITLNLTKSDAKRLLNMVKMSRTRACNTQKMIITLLSEQLEMLNN